MKLFKEIAFGFCFLVGLLLCASEPETMDFVPNFIGLLMICIAVWIARGLEET